MCVLNDACFLFVYRNEEPKAAEMYAHVGAAQAGLSSVCFCEDRHRHHTNRFSLLHHRVRAPDRPGKSTCMARTPPYSLHSPLVY